MKKIIVLTVLIAVLAAGFVSAQGYYGAGPKSGAGGRNQDTEKTYGGPGMMGGTGFSSIAEIRELSGELVVRENDFPAIKTGKDEISVTIPADAIDALKLKTGSKITVKGIEMPARNWNITGEKLIRVFELGYDGKKYSVMGGPMGGRPGMQRDGMQGRGRR